MRYEAVNAMLFNEFLRDYRNVEALEDTVAKQRTEFAAQIAQQQKQIEALTATMRKASDQLKLNRRALQMVAADK